MAPRANRINVSLLSPLYYVGPTILLLLAIVAYPIAHSFYISLHKTEYLRIGGFTGLSNYLALLHDDIVQRDFIITIKYVLGSLSGAVPIGLLLAIILNQRLPGFGILRTICTLPWVISQTVSALLWIWFLNPSYGPVNYALSKLSIPTLDFRADVVLALPTLIGVNVWMSYPFAMILFLAGLQTIPEELYEAARIDGASVISEFYHITLPLIKNTMMAACVMLTLYYFTMVTLIFVFTGGGPAKLTEVLSLRIFNEAFFYWRMGTASALGVVVFVLNAVFSLIYIKVLRREAEL